jgi:sorbitol/mannitol transport system permease protein
MLARSGSPAPARRLERAGWLRAVVAWLVALVVSFPFLYLVLTGLKREAEAPKMPPAFLPFGREVLDSPWAFTPMLQNYETVLGGGFMPFLVNSITAVAVSTFLVLVLGIPAAYALTWAETTRKRNVLFFFISTRFLPAVGVIIPIFIIAKTLNLIDNIAALIVLYTAMNLPIAVWMLRSFFQDLPRDVLDAASVDGAGRLQELVMIALPLIRSGVVATIFLCIVFSWNEFFFALVLTTTQAATVPLYMIGFMTAQGLWYAKMAAAGTMAALPIVILGWLGQRQLVRGLSMGAVK